MKPIALVSLALIAATSAHAAVTISSAKTRNMNCTGGVCAPTGGNANLNVRELQTMLVSSDVTVKSNASAPSLGVLDPLTWASTHRLTLDAYQSIHVKAPVVIEGTSGLTLTTNDGGTGGDYIFEDGGTATFWDLASSLVINGQSYVLVSDIKTLASDIAANHSGNYALANSYDASVDGTHDQSPIVDTFEGSFEGLGNAISNLSIVDLTHSRRPLYVGLFKQVDGSLHDIRLENAFVMGGKGSFVGTIAGYNRGSIAQAFASGKVLAINTGRLGGLVADNSGLLANVQSDVEVVCRTRSACVSVGGVAANNYGQIIGSEAHGIVSGGRNSFDVGGLVGFNSGTVETSHATGSVTTGTSMGGLVGTNDGTIADSYATGTVMGSFHLGGLVGTNTQFIVRSYATGTVQPVQTENYITAGGLVGLNQGSISQSHASGQFSANCGGGLAGDNKGTISLSFASGGTFSNNSNPGGGLACSNEGTIQQSYATGALFGLAGGLVSTNSGTISQSYATGSVAAGPQNSGCCVGGLVMSYIGGTISQSYSTGKVTGDGHPGGSIGSDSTYQDDLAHVYWDTTTSGLRRGIGSNQKVRDSNGVTGLTTTQFQSALPTGFDPNVWGQSASINNGWPYLLANPPQ